MAAVTTEAKNRVSAAERLAGAKVADPAAAERTTAGLRAIGVDLPRLPDETLLKTETMVATWPDDQLIPPAALWAVTSR